MATTGRERGPGEPSHAVLDAKTVARPSREDTVAQPGFAPADAPATGRIGRFTILRELGRGAMGVVLAAYDQELDRKVAIKLMHPLSELDPSQGRAVLLREAQSMARLAHPNVVAVHEVGVVEGAVFVAMEYIAGVDLQRWLADRPRPWREVVGVLRQAGLGLMAAHREGLIHRDFKPSNVLVGDDGRVRVADFGLATRRGERGGDGGAPEQDEAGALWDGALVGTPLYMAPELLHGAPASAATDQYALCVVLYEALHGVRPFAGETLARLMLAVEQRSLPATPPNPAVPAWLHAAVCRGLAQAPEQRFASLAELVDLLARDPEAERLQRRRLALRTAGVIAGTALIVTLAVLAYGALRRLAIERQAEGRLAVLRGQVAELRGRGADADAARLLQSFVALEENHGLPVVARAYLEWAAAETDVAAAIDAYASAYITALTGADSIAALRGLVDRLGAQGMTPEAAAALKVLEQVAPAAAAAPELQEVRLAAALWRRDLAAARASLPDADAAAWSSVLADISMTTTLDGGRIGGPFDLASRELAVLDHDGDGVAELLTWAGRSTLRIHTADLAMAPIRSVSLGAPTATAALAPVVPGEPLFLASYPLAPPVYEIRLLTFTPDGATRTLLAWADSFLFNPVTVDLAGDGRREVYVGTEAYARRFWRLDRADDGTWSRRSAHAGTDAAMSDVVGVVTADLDGDGQREIATTVGPWRAYDLRAFAPGPADSLELIARRSFGSFKKPVVVRAPGGDLLAFVKTDFQVQQTRFPPDRPKGEPNGLYLVGLRDGALTTVGFLPETRPGAGKELDVLHVGDLDGDGRDELVFGIGDAMGLLRWREGAPLHPLVLAGVRPALVHDFDGDGRAEILAQPTDRPGQMVVLGAGDTPLPPLPKLEIEPRPVPREIDDPAVASAWARAEQTVAIGLPRRAAAELATLARLAGPVAQDILFRTAEIDAGVGDDEAAAEHYIAAASRPDLAVPALEGAAAARKRLAEFAAAEALTRRRLALVGPEARPAVAAELAALQLATAPRPELPLTFTTPLDPRWRIVDPVAVRRSLSRGALEVWTAPSPVLAELPLAWDGGPVTVELELELDRVEYGADLTIELTRPDGQPWLTTSVRGRGMSTTPETVLMVSGGQDLERLTFRPQARTIRTRLAAYPQFATVLREIDAGPQSDRRVLPVDDLWRAPPPGSLSLRVTSRTVAFGAVSHLWIRSIRLTGLTLAAADVPADDPAWLLAENQPRAALALLGDATAGSEAQMWRIDALLRLGRLDEAKLEVVSLLAADPDRGAPYVRLAHRLRRGDDAALLVARETFGKHLVELLITTYGDMRAQDCEAVLRDLPPSDPQDRSSDPLARHWLVLTDYARGLAFARAGRIDEAHEALEAALNRDTADVPYAPEVNVVWSIRSELLKIAVARGDRAQAIKWIRHILQHDPSPGLSFELLQPDVPLRELLGDDMWGTLQAESERADDLPMVVRSRGG